MMRNEMGNLEFPIIQSDNQFQYDFDESTQLQFFGVGNYCAFATNATGIAGCGVDPVSYMGNQLVPPISRPMKRRRQAENSPMPQKRQLCLNGNFYQDEVDRSANIIMTNPVSTGLGLSYDDELKTSIASANNRTMAALPIVSTLSNNLTNEMDRQKEEFEHFIRVQEEQMAKGAWEMNQRHMASVLRAVEKEVGKKLMEKQIEIDDRNRTNMELVERINQVAKEVHSWRSRAIYNESMINVLKSNINNIIARYAEEAKEGFGDSEVEDAASSYVDKNNHVNDSRHGESVTSNDNKNRSLKMQKISCKLCKGNEASILLLPCRHLCLCKNCEGSIDLCPVCHSPKTTTVQVYMS